MAIDQKTDLNTLYAFVGWAFRQVEPFGFDKKQSGMWNRIVFNVRLIGY